MTHLFTDAQLLFFGFVFLVLAIIVQFAIFFVKTHGIEIRVDQLEHQDKLLRREIER
jgi:hypothetical protein